MIYYPPLTVMPDIPVGNHFGSFGVRRKYSYHSGVDLYTEEGNDVYAIEPGIVTEINHFTGSKAGYPWWEDTDCICIEGYSGVLVYGEIRVSDISLGKNIKKGECLGKVKRVLRHDKGKPTSMLHIMLLEHSIREDSIKSWKHNKLKPKGLLDPTPILIQCRINYSIMLTSRIRMDEYSFLP